MKVARISKPSFSIKANTNTLGNRLTAHFLDFSLYSRIGSSSIYRGSWAINRIKIDHAIREVEPGNKLFLIFWVACAEIADYAIIHLIDPMARKKRKMRDLN